MNRSLINLPDIFPDSFQTVNVIKVLNIRLNIGFCKALVNFSQ